MNMLIIGNGFDLAHGRPTKYEDFLKFLELILEIQNCRLDRANVEKYLNKDCPNLCPTVREYLLSSFDTRLVTESGYVRNRTDAVQELYDCLDRNVWYEYFQLFHKENQIHGKMWIDFESEIRGVIEFLDRKIDDLYEPISPDLLTLNKVPLKIAHFVARLDFTEYNRVNNKSELYKNTYFDFIEKTYDDLQKLVRCLEIYLDDCIKKIPIHCLSPDIQGLNVDSVLSFNYTDIPTDIYPSLPNPHHIHGCARTMRLATENNMVLGVNEYWEGRDKNIRTNFNLYKKFVQRIMKQTGIEYKNALEKMHSDYETSVKSKTLSYIGPNCSCVYIFGHSLDVTDGDILREVIQTKGVITTIFYRDKQQQANQIANLSKVLDQDYLLEHIFSTEPTIIFKQQANMVNI